MWLVLDNEKGHCHDDWPSTSKVLLKNDDVAIHSRTSHIAIRFIQPLIPTWFCHRFDPETRSSYDFAKPTSQIKSAS